jgi:TonB family protein
MFPRISRFVLLLTVVSAIGLAGAQDTRKAKSEVKPAFPEIGRKMNLTTTVKVQVEISPAGTVTSAKAIGGHPVFLESAVDAARKWRFEPAQEASTQVLEFKFVNPQTAQ